MRELIEDIEAIDARRYEGRVASVQGLLLEAEGPAGALALGARASVETAAGICDCEVVGFRGERALLMPFGDLSGVRAGAPLKFSSEPMEVRPCTAWLGRVIDGLGQPVDGGGPLEQGVTARPVRAAPPRAHARARVGGRLDLGVRALNIFAPICRGQRMGLFAGSGVGKSVLLGMLAKNADADVIVIGLIGERGREVREFVEDVLGPDGRSRSVVVVATSDETPLKRRQAASMTLAVAEHFRDQGLEVLCLMDSVTRVAFAQREIGLAAGEPPTTRGYTPSVFSELPRLLERAGPGVERKDRPAGSITGLFTVLVEGGDHDEPIADAVRGILDGHIVMERAIAERGRYPAVNVLKSVSRTLPGCASEGENALIADARKLMSTYEDMAELIRLGAYAAGSNPEVDEAIRVQPKIEAVLAQTHEEITSLDEGFALLSDAIGPQETGAAG
ncbi:MAG: flagellar protein export ATPase FliI [Maricaulaceae bacterium]|jgi:flagellum-specific ATP synthase